MDSLIVDHDKRTHFILTGNSFTLSKADNSPRAREPSNSTSMSSLIAEVKYFQPRIDKLYLTEGETTGEILTSDKKTLRTQYIPVPYDLQFILSLKYCVFISSICSLVISRLSLLFEVIEPTFI